MFSRIIYLLNSSSRSTEHDIMALSINGCFFFFSLLPLSFSTVSAVFSVCASAGWQYRSSIVHALGMCVCVFACLPGYDFSGSSCGGAGLSDLVPVNSSQLK